MAGSAQAAAKRLSSTVQAAVMAVFFAAAAALAAEVVISADKTSLPYAKGGGLPILRPEPVLLPQNYRSAALSALTENRLPGRVPYVAEALVQKFLTLIEDETHGALQRSGELLEQVRVQRPLPPFALTGNKAEPTLIAGGSIRRNCSGRRGAPWLRIKFCGINIHKLYIFFLKPHWAAEAQIYVRRRRACGIFSSGPVLFFI